MTISYIYDPYGNIVSATGSMALKNPLRYRGYYYDQETGFYYLNARYYDPKIGRFLNADAQMAGIDGNPLEYNLFAYCLNNPINMCDPDGNWPKWLTNTIDWITSTFGIKLSTKTVVKSGTSATAKGVTISMSSSMGAISSKASGTLGYATGSFRGQVTQSGGSANKTMLGGFGKVSVVNSDLQNRVGTQNFGVSKKNVRDVGVLTAQAGIQYKGGLGIALGAKASVASARSTYCVDIFGWKVEAGLSAQFLSYGYEFAYGKLPDGSWGVKKGVSTGLWGYGYLIRITPP